MKPCMRVILVGLAIVTAPLFAQQIDLPAPGPGGPGTAPLRNWARDLQDKLGLDDPNTKGILSKAPMGDECEVTLTVYQAGNKSRQMTYKYTIPFPCDYVELGEYQVRILPTPASKKNPLINALLQLWQHFFGGDSGPRSAQAFPEFATAATGARNATAGPEVLDLPLTPPFSNGQDLLSNQGCDPDNPYVGYVLNHDANSVTRIEGCPGRATVTIPVASKPLQLQVTPDGKTLVVTSYDHAITFIDTATNKVTSTLTTPDDIYPSGIVISEDGRRGYVASFWDSPVSVVMIDMVNRKIGPKVPVFAQYAQNLYLSPDETTLWVTFRLTSAIYVIDVLTNSVAYTIGSIVNPYGIAFNPTGTLAYITSFNTPGSVKVLDVVKNEIVDSYDVGDNPRRIEITTDGRQLIVENFGSNFLSVIDLMTRTVTQIPSRGTGSGLVLIQ
jgi:YVTN family beta-propeller protein